MIPRDVWYEVWMRIEVKHQTSATWRVSAYFSELKVPFPIVIVYYNIIPINAKKSVKQHHTYAIAFCERVKLAILFSIYSRCAKRVPGRAWTTYTKTCTANTFTWNERCCRYSGCTSWRAYPRSWRSCCPPQKTATATVGTDCSTCVTRYVRIVSKPHSKFVLSCVLAALERCVFARQFVRVYPPMYYYNNITIIVFPHLLCNERTMYFNILFCRSI